MTRPREKSWWPWYCAGLTLTAFTLGMLAGGPADWIAAALLAVPVVVVLRHLYATVR